MHVLIASQNCSLRRSDAVVFGASCISVLRSSKRAMGVPGGKQHAHIASGGGNKGACSILPLGSLKYN